VSGTLCVTEPKPSDHLKIALAGQPNVGKSTVFNMLTGLNQHVGNWPGKTVEMRSGTLEHHGLLIDIVDLPGTYSLTASSPEEVVAREFICCSGMHSPSLSWRCRFITCQTGAPSG